MAAVATAALLSVAACSSDAPEVSSIELGSFETGGKAVATAVLEFEPPSQELCTVTELASGTVESICWPIADAASLRALPLASFVLVGSSGAELPFLSVMRAGSQVTPNCGVLAVEDAELPGSRLVAAYGVFDAAGCGPDFEFTFVLDELRHEISTRRIARN